MCVFEGAESAIATYSATAVVSSGFKIVTPQGNDGIPLLFRTRTECIEGILPISKGGTGISEITGSKLIASSVSGSSLEEIDIPVSYLSGLTGNIQSILNTKEDSIRSYSVNVTSTKSSWTSHTDNGVVQYWSKVIPLSGITENDNPLVSLIPSSSSKDGIVAEQYAFSCMNHLITSNGSITIYCFDDLPSTDFIIQLICV